MASITGWSSMTSYTSPTVRQDQREKPDFSTLDQDGSGGLDQAELTALLEKDPKPPERPAEEGGWAGMQMDTQSFATMMKGPPPPPPPSISKLDSDDDGSITIEEFSVSSDDEDDLFSAIDSDSSGDLSADEVSEFEQKMKTLFSRLQDMGSAQYLSVANATTQTNDANLNLSA